MSAPKRDYLAILDAAYAPVQDNQDWLSGIARAASPIVDAGISPVAYTYDARDPAAFRIDAMGFARMPTTAYERLGVTQIEHFSPANLRAFYLESGPVELGREIGKRVVLSEEYLTILRNVGASDSLGVHGRDPSGKGIMLAAPSLGPYRLPARRKAALGRVATHLAAAFRLRLAGGNAELDTADAVFTPRGKLEHMIASIRDGESRKGLGRAVEARQLGQKLRQAEPEQALELWRALVSGRWSLVDHADRDGKRFIVARRNCPTVAEPSALTESERLVAAYVAQGHSNKLITYELGLGAATVSELLRSALWKLRLRSKTELVRIFHARL